ncbi:MAG: hypothetical protein JWO67_96 [Streptosporangiaceae bacterium]|jgi:hypothetical protein|nr:hypothetical protein [Streptosporangiaceae bacterium]
MLYPATTITVILSTAGDYMLGTMAGAGLVAMAFAFSWLLNPVYPANLLSREEKVFVRESDLRTSVPVFPGDVPPIGV